MNARQVEEILKKLTAIENQPFPKATTENLEKMNRYLESKSNSSISSGSSSKSTTSSTRSSKAKISNSSQNQTKVEPDSNDEIYPKSMAGVELIKNELAESERKYNLSRRGLNPNAKEFYPIFLSKWIF